MQPALAVNAPVERMDELLLAAAARTPERPAVVEHLGSDGIRVHSYRRLEQKVREYARALDATGLGIGDRVLIHADTDVESIALFLACSSLGLPFVPVSPEAPEQRLRTIVETAEPALFAHAAGGSPSWLPPGTGSARFGAGGLEPGRPVPPRARVRREITGTDTAYMIFTSGTTGRPKGVVMSHRGVTSFYRGMLAHALITPDDRVASTSPLQFDFSLLDIGLALGSGAAVVPVPRDVVRFPRRFVGLLDAAEVTHVNGVPSIWRSALRHEAEALARLDRLTSVLYCGEPFPLTELRALQGLLPRLRIVNCYGATESMACSFTDVPRPLPDDLENPSIGFAHPGAEMLLVDPWGRPVERPGEVGEIYLRSPALFTGYWDDPVATAAVLVADPLEPRSGQIVFRTGDLAYRGEAGDLYFAGRADDQVQIRGNRVELGEVERRILEFPGVAAAAAVVVPDGAEGEYALGVFAVAARGAEVQERALRSFCRDSLPAYMIPKAVRLVDELPVTPNGKTDRKALAGLLTTP
ncbi:AMP-binding protein [Streptomyces sp. NPDC056503]|uniref:AMP-binding protein n=1 Tax=Streptomyces sp. NPDC056503 TaxID=3345842 RepID=UPI0036ABD3B4